MKKLILCSLFSFVLSFGLVPPENVQAQDTTQTVVPAVTGVLISGAAILTSMGVIFPGFMDWCTRSGTTAEASKGMSEAAAGTSTGATGGGTEEEKTATRAIMCPMALMAGAQIVTQGITMGVTAATAEEAGGGGGGPLGAPDFGPSNGGINEFGSSEARAAIDTARAGLKTLENMGFKMNDDGTVTTPRGTAPASALGSGQAMADAGLIDSDQIDDYDKALSGLKAQQDKIRTKALAAAGGAGGFRGGRRGSRNPASYGLGANPYALPGAKKPKAAKTSGLTKKFGDSNIGTATDDVFQMLTLRYQALEKQKQFIDNAKGTYER